MKNVRFNPDIVIIEPYKKKFTNKIIYWLAFIKLKIKTKLQ